VHSAVLLFNCIKISILSGICKKKYVKKQVIFNNNEIKLVPIFLSIIQEGYNKGSGGFCAI